MMVKPADSEGGEVVAGRAGVQRPDGYQPEQELQGLGGGCFVSYDAIEMPGYRKLRAGQHVRFTFEQPGFIQDGCRYRALTVWPAE